MTIAERFYARYMGHQRVIGRYTLSNKPNNNGPKVKGRALTKQETPTVEHWGSHLSGSAGFGLVPIQENNSCVWGLIDIDKYDLDLIALSKQIDELALPVVLLRTKSGGAHVTLFTNEPVPAKLMRAKLRSIEGVLGFRGSEIFPKQEQITQEDFGNWVNMPYFKMADTQRYAIVEGENLTAEAFLDHANDMALGAEELKHWSPGQVSDDSEFEGAPPCLRHYIQHGFPQGSMNDALFSMGVFARKKFPEEWENKVMEYNQRFMGPGHYNEVQNIIRSLKKKTYVYKCSNPPLEQVCDRRECLTCQFGIKDAKAKKDQRPCILESVDRPIKKYTPPAGSKDDPYYTLKLGGKEMEVTVDEILSQARFTRLFFITFNKKPLPVTEDRWTECLNDLMEEAIEEAMPLDAGPEGQLMGLVESFCLTNSQARDKEELVLGKPWTNEGRTWFRSKDILKYVHQQGFRAFKLEQFYPIFRRHGLTHTNFHIKGTCVAAWSMPAYLRQREDFTDPPLPPDEEVPF